MIRRVFKGKSPSGLVKYLYGEGRRNEHTDAHLVASWDGHPAGLEPEWVEGAGMHHIAPLVSTLEAPVKACSRPPKQFVYHLVLRNDENDRRLSDDEWGQVCTDAMARTNIAPAGDPAGCRWVAVRHAEDHVHLVATLAREDGRAPRVWNDYAQLAGVAHDAEERFGLRSTAGRDDKTAAARPGVKEQVAAENARRTVPPRVALRQQVKAAAASTHGYTEFADRLRQHGVSVWPRMSDRDPDQITGLSFSLDDYRSGGEPVRFGGGKLAPDLSWPKLSARWDTHSPADDNRSHDNAAGHSTFGDAAAADRVWRDAEQIVADAAQQIRTDAGTDPDGAADAAWAASDALAAAAAAVEGDAGGPLTDAAEAFERAGRETWRRIPQRSDTGHALRTVGRCVTALTAGSKNPAARQAAVTMAMLSLVHAVGDLRSAQQRLHQAEAAYTSAQHLQRVAPLAKAGARPRTAAEQARLAMGGDRGTTRFTPTGSAPRDSSPHDSTRRRGPAPGTDPHRGGRSR